MNLETKQIANATALAIGVVAVYFTAKHAERKEASKRAERKAQREAQLRDADKFLKNLPLWHDHYRRSLEERFPGMQ